MPRGPTRPAAPHSWCVVRGDLRAVDLGPLAGLTALGPEAWELAWPPLALLMVSHLPLVLTTVSLLCFRAGLGVTAQEACQDRQAPR